MDDNPITLNPEDAAKLVGVSRSTLFNLLREGKLRSFKIGRRRLVSRHELERFVKEQERAA